MPDDFEGTIDDIGIAVSEEGIVDVSIEEVIPGMSFYGLKIQILKNQVP